MSGEIAWGTTIAGTLSTGEEMREWTVELASESLGSFAVDTTVARFADEVSRLAPGAVPACSLTLGRFGMSVTVAAPGPGEAADEATELFERVLAAAVWPRSIPTPFAPCDVTVRPAAGVPPAA